MPGKEKQKIYLLCPLHRTRLEIARYLKQHPKTHVDTFGTFDGGENIPIATTLKDYRFSIVIENDISKYFFTEKILNCFAAMTIPIYLGASGIDNFFDSDGIIKITLEDCNNIEKVLSSCTREEYAARIEAVKKNYTKVLEFTSVEDYIYRNYLEKDPFFSSEDRYNNFIY